MLALGVLIVYDINLDLYSFFSFWMIELLLGKQTWLQTLEIRQTLTKLLQLITLKGRE